MSYHSYGLLSYFCDQKKIKPGGLFYAISKTKNYKSRWGWPFSSSPSDFIEPFKNGEIDSLLARIGIKRSLSNPGCPYDNACAETLFGKMKIEFVRNKVFKSMDEVKLELFQYVWWYNNKRLHSSLGYLSPVAYKNKNMFVQI